MPCNQEMDGYKGRLLSPTSERSELRKRVERTVRKRDEE